MVCWPKYPSGSGTYRVNKWGGLPGHYLQVAYSGNGPVCGLRTDHTVLCLGQYSFDPWVGHKYVQVSMGYGNYDPSGQNNQDGDLCVISRTAEVYCWPTWGSDDLSLIAPSASPQPEWRARRGRSEALPAFWRLRSRAGGSRPALPYGIRAGIPRLVAPPRGAGLPGVRVAAWYRASWQESDFAWVLERLTLIEGSQGPAPPGGFSRRLRRLYTSENQTPST
jgi:hypothetical protein